MRDNLAVLTDGIECILIDAIFKLPGRMCRYTPIYPIHPTLSTAMLQEIRSQWDEIIEKAGLE